MQLTVSSSPHIFDGGTTRRIMIDVLIALLPATAGAVYFFGLNVLVLVLASVASAMLAEFACQKLAKRPVTVSDCSAAVTGLLVALNIPPTAPWWMPVVGSAFAIVVVKQLFGGLGHNFMNPALIARAVLMASWAGRMTAFVSPVDAVSSATTLGVLKDAVNQGVLDTWGADLPGLMDMFIGRTAGCVGETSEALLIIGGVYLLLRGVINLRIPLTYILTFFVMTCLLSPTQSFLLYALINLVSGGLFLGAIYMATDYASSPMTKWGQVIFGVGCGVLTAVIRRFGAYPEGVSYAILIMNVAAPLISKYTAPKSFGRQVLKNA